MKTVTCNDTGEVCKTYQEYLDSLHWYLVKKTYMAAKLPDVCYVCKSKKHLDLHHKTYTRIGREKMKDLVYLCRSCHGEAHRLLKEWFDDLIIVPVKEPPKPPEKTVKIWCAASGFPDCLGWAIIMEYKGYKKEFSGVAKRDQFTQCSVVLYAIIEALKKLKEPCDVMIATKDHYVIKGLNYWMDRWEKKGYKTKKGTRKSADYWKEIAVLKQTHNITAIYTNGSDPIFNRIHELAHEKARLINVIIHKEVISK